MWDGGYGCMNRLGARTWRDISELASKEWKKAKPVVALEHVHSTPRMGVRSAFTFGYEFGRICAILEALKLEYTLVPPQVWMEKMECLTAGDKRITLNAAKERFPEIPITHSTADALLIAAYAREVLA